MVECIQPIPDAVIQSLADAIFFYYYLFLLYFLKEKGVYMCLLQTCLFHSDLLTLLDARWWSASRPLASVILGSAFCSSIRYNIWLYRPEVRALLTATLASVLPRNDVKLELSEDLTIAPLLSFFPE